MRITIAVLASVAALTASSALAETPAEVTDRLLVAGKLGEADSTLKAMLDAEPNNDEARFGLGVTRFLRGAERLSRSFYRYGLAGDGLIMQNLVPFARLPIPPNAHPEPIRYDDLRRIMQEFLDDLANAERTLAAVGDREVKLPLRLGRIRLDLNGDGQAEPEERLWELFLAISTGSLNQLTGKQIDGFVVAFDRGDVAWLRGYCHLLMAMAEAYLAHDGQQLFDHTAPLFFAKPVTRFPFLLRDPGRRAPDFELEILDLIAMIHLIRMPVLQADRMKAALEHLESMIVLSRESWKYSLAETDNDREWVPNPSQLSGYPGGRVSEAMVKAWMTFLDESDAILKGKLLIPFWRRGEGRGINLRRVFTEPRPFDLVLWFQGTAAVPYLEKGPLSAPQTWQRLQEVFGGHFIGFAFWFN